MESTAPAAAFPPCMTPYETLAGYQDGANREFVSGWAWDRDRPTTPLSVTIYDGETCLATVTADHYRADLRDAGIGTGRHGFLYRFPRPIRDRKRHHITVRIAGRCIVLRDVRTNALPEPITRRDRVVIPPIPHFSLTPLARWGYFSFFKGMLRPFSCPMYRGLAVFLAVFVTVTDRENWRLCAALLEASGQPATMYARLRLHWWRSYRSQAALLLTAQAAKLTPAWVTRHITYTGKLPTGGAILITSHHAAQFLGTALFAAQAPVVAFVTAQPQDANLLALVEPTLRSVWQHQNLTTDRITNIQMLSLGQVGRDGLRVLARGGSVVILVDAEPLSEPAYSLLGRAHALPRGPVWLAARSGKPILPFAIVPDGLGWRLWLGDAVALTHEGVMCGLDACVRQTLASWDRREVAAWLRAPAWPDPSAREGRESQ